MMSNSTILSQLIEVIDRMKAARTGEEREAVFTNLKQNRVLFNAFLRQRNPSDMEQHLEKIYKILTTTQSNEVKDAALTKLKSSLFVMKAFLKKTIPPSESLPAVDNNPTQTQGVFIPQRHIMYKIDLAKVNNAIRAAISEEERDAVFDEVIDKPHLFQEFLKNNVPQLSNL